MPQKPSQAAEFLLLQSTHDLVLRFGQYLRFLRYSERIAANLPTATAADRILKARVLVFAGEIALYCEQEARYAPIVGESLKKFRHSKELSTVRATAELIAARLFGRTKLVKQERALMEGSFPIDAPPDSRIYGDWVFRKTAFYKERREHDKAIALANTLTVPPGDDRARILTSNVLSEIARIYLDTGQPLQARNVFQEVLSISTDEFHRRGILITSIFLARANLALENYTEAVDGLLVASQCTDVAQWSDKIALEDIRYDLEEKLALEGFMKLQSNSL